MRRIHQLDLHLEADLLKGSLEMQCNFLLVLVGNGQGKSEWLTRAILQNPVLDCPSRFSQLADRCPQQLAVLARAITHGKGMAAVEIGRSHATARRPDDREFGRICGLSFG